MVRFRMVWMGLDIGTRRIGVALSDTLGMIAQPFSTLEALESGRVPVDALRALVTEHHVEGIVVGWPRRMDGSRGPEAEAAEEVAKDLETALGVAVVLWDERLTSVQAERMLVEAGVRRKDRKGATDRVAAALILQGYLDRTAIDASSGAGE